MAAWLGKGRAGVVVATLVLSGAACGQAGDASPQPETGEAEATAERINPMISLHQAGQPVFGLYAPSPRVRRPPGSEDASAPPPAEKTPDQLASETLAFQGSDFVFDGTMEGGVDAGLPPFTAYRNAMTAAGASARTHPIMVKMDVIRTDPEAAVRDIGRQLDLGVSGIMFVEVESAEELRTGLAAMRYPEHGGTRADGVGEAPAYWGVGEAEYREKADLWPLNPRGELINWTIIETPEGLRNVREIAAVEGIGVLWPGAGSLRGVFTTTGPDGERVFDEAAWEASIQSVLAACKEFNIPCGYPANASDIQMRMEQGFEVFVMGWGESGFETVRVGREAAGR
jgi:2-keto-3-deoxy-L-rhamnonate aldolase RhmA